MYLGWYFLRRSQLGLHVLTKSMDKEESSSEDDEPIQTSRTLGCSPKAIVKVNKKTSEAS